MLGYTTQKKIKSTAFFTGKIKSATVYPANSWESPVVASEFYVPVDNLSSHLGSYIKQVGWNFFPFTNS